MIYYWVFFCTFLLQILFTGSEQVNFQVGDTYGFSWTQYGVIPFDASSDYNYCEDDQALPAAGSTFTLKAGRHGNRFYSLQAIYNPTVSGDFYLAHDINEKNRTHFLSSLDFVSLIKLLSFLPVQWTCSLFM